jgi:polyisoprenoid-binding protein YceI
MKTTMLTIAFAGLGLLAIATPPKTKSANADNYKVIGKESLLKWHAKKVTGEHSGTVIVSGGEVITEGKNLISANVIVDMTSLDATDIQGEYHDKLVGHLKSDDFFSVEKHKSATLKIKSATAIKGAAPGTNNYDITADLTIKGITQEIKFPAFVIINGGKVIANADFNIDRSKFDIRYGSKTFFAEIGDKAIDDEFNIKVRIVATK